MFEQILQRRALIKGEWYGVVFSPDIEKYSFEYQAIIIPVMIPPKYSSSVQALMFGKNPDNRKKRYPGTAWM